MTLEICQYPGNYLNMKNTIFNFDHFLVYLAGAIQFAADNGFSWRADVTNKMVDIGIPRNQILNPCDKPMNNFYHDDLDANIEKLNLLREQGKWEEIERISKHTLRVDLRMIEKSDLIYVHLDPKIPTFGTPDEIGMACLQRKPVIVVVPGGIKNCSYWIIGRVGYKNIFSNDDDAISYINDIMHGKTIMDHKKWLFFDMRREKCL